MNLLFLYYNTKDIRYELCGRVAVLPAAIIRVATSSHSPPPLAMCRTPCAHCACALWLYLFTLPLPTTKSERSARPFRY